MKILLYGEAERAGSGAWCYAQTLRDLGHEVCVFSDDYRLKRYNHSLFWKGYRKLTGSVAVPHRKQHISSLIRFASETKPAAVIVLKGLQIGPDEVRLLKKHDCWVVNVNHDDFFSRNPNNWSPLQRSAIPEYDYIFATREVNVEEVSPLNRNVEFFPFAYYPKLHRPLPDEDNHRWKADVVFAGTWEANRAEILERLVTEVRCTYSIYGLQWRKVGKTSPLRPFIRGGEATMDDLAKAITNSKIALGFLRKENRDDYTQRTFEIPACAGVFLGERTGRHQEYYREGIEAEFFDSESKTELADKTRLLLADHAKREAIRQAGRAALLAQKQTYSDRLQRLLAVYALR